MSSKPAAAAQSILAQRIIAAQTLTPQGTNAHQALNTLLLQNQKKQMAQALYDQRGETCPQQVISLAMDAARPARHSRILARNLNLNSGLPRPQFVAAHHIVAQQAWQAYDARMCLFGWGIAINDADNGVYLPRYASSNVPSLPHALPHQSLHTDLYYLSVNITLKAADPLDSNDGRAALRTIKAELLNGTFPR